MKLKTLKDLEFDDWTYTLGEGRIIKIAKLKAEAIKWVKFQKDIQMNNPNYANEYRLNIQWIKNFFNITEEDLK